MMPLQEFYHLHVFLCVSVIVLYTAALIFLVWSLILWFSPSRYYPFAVMLYLMSSAPLGFICYCFYLILYSLIQRDIIKNCVDHSCFVDQEIPWFGNFGCFQWLCLVYFCGQHPQNRKFPAKWSGDVNVILCWM